MLKVLSRSAVQSLAHCELKGDVMSGGLWMPIGNPAFAFRTDFPLARRPHSFAMPGIYTWDSVKNGTQNGNRYVDRRKAVNN